MKTKSEVVYRFIESEIQPGDILLSTDKTSMLSWGIRKATQSPYSHAAICYSPPEFIEAISTGVSRINVMRFFVEDRSCVEIRRLRSDYPTSTEFSMRAAEEAAWYLGNNYWTIGALSSLSSKTSRRQINSVFCSHLVASAYEAAGVRLVEGKSAEKIIPADIERSLILENVGDSILKPVDYDVACLWGIPLENGFGLSPHRHETDTSRQVRDYVNAWLKKRGLPEQQNFYQLLNFMRDFPGETIRLEMDEIFCSGLKKSGYLDILANKDWNIYC